MYQIIEGDLLTCTDSIICQQLNCLCVRAHGLSADIAKKYPYSNVYAERKAIGTRNLCIPEDAGVPGNIEVRSGFGPIVIGQGDRCPPQTPSTLLGVSEFLYPAQTIYL